MTYIVFRCAAIHAPATSCALRRCEATDEGARESHARGPYPCPAIRAKWAFTSDRLHLHHRGPSHRTDLRGLGGHVRWGPHHHERRRREHRVHLHRARGVRTESALPLRARGDHPWRDGCRLLLAGVLPLLPPLPDHGDAETEPAPDLGAG